MVFLADRTIKLLIVGTLLYSTGPAYTECRFLRHSGRNEVRLRNCFQLDRRRRLVVDEATLPGGVGISCITDATNAVVFVLVVVVVISVVVVDDDAVGLEKKKDRTAAGRNFAATTASSPSSVVVDDGGVLRITISASTAAGGKSRKARRKAIKQIVFATPRFLRKIFIVARSCIILLAVVV